MSATRRDGFRTRVWLGASCSAPVPPECRKLRRLIQTSAEGAHAHVINDCRRAYAEVDVLRHPHQSLRRLRVGEKAGDPLAMYLSDICTIPSNLVRRSEDLRSVRKPRPSGLQMGFQVLAPALGEAVVRVAKAVERLSRFTTPCIGHLRGCGR